MSFLKIEKQEQFKIVRQAVKAWNKDKFLDSQMLSLLSVQRRLSDADHVDDSVRKRAVRYILQEALQKLEKSDSELAHVIQLRFIEGFKLDVAAARLNVSVATLSRNQDRACWTLVEILQQFEQDEIYRRAKLQSLDLPSRDYDRLFGIEPIISDMTARVLAEDEYFMLALIGMGGIGKSTIAREIAQRVIRELRFHRVLWVTFPQEDIPLSRSADAVFAQILSKIAAKLIPAAPPVSPEQTLQKIREILLESPYLIIIDNLEMKDEIAVLADRLQGLIRPSKILFGSRARPFQPLIYAQDVSELNQHNAYDYFSYLQRNSNVASLSPDQFAEIHQTIGGNPLMLKLTVSLLRQCGFDELLDALRQGDRDTHKDYRRIYWRLWSYLSEDAKEILLCMITGDLSEGLEREELLDLSEMPESRFQQAVNELHYNSLLLFHETPDGRSYNIHRVTETFVRHDIIAQLSLQSFP